MKMNFKNTDHDGQLIGTGDLYAIEAENFTYGTTTIADMVNVGYIKEGATFRRNCEKKEHYSANMGLINITNGDYVTEFETGIISYDADKVSRFLTGASVITTTNAQGTEKVTRFKNSDESPFVALIFIGTDEKSGKEFQLIMPKCIWFADGLEFEFNNDDPVALNYYFKCLDVALPTDANPEVTEMVSAVIKEFDPSVTSTVAED